MLYAPNRVACLFSIPSGLPLGTNPPSVTKAIFAERISFILDAGSILPYFGSVTSDLNGSPLSLLNNMETTRTAPVCSDISLTKNPREKYPSSDGVPIFWLVASLDAIPTILEIASAIPAIDSRVFTIYASFEKMSTPGFSSCIPVTAGIPSCFSTALHTAPQAIP